MQCGVVCFWRPTGRTQQNADLDLWAFALQVLTFKKTSMCSQDYCAGGKPEAFHRVFWRGISGTNNLVREMLAPICIVPLAT